MTRAGIRNVALVLLIFLLPLPYYALHRGTGTLTWLALTLVVIVPRGDWSADEFTLGVLQALGYAGLLWVIASYAASRLATFGDWTRGFLEWLLSLALISLACLPLCTLAGASGSRIPAILLYVGMFVVATLS